MKKSILLVMVFLFFSLPSKAQFTTDILYETSDSEINLYIVSQGFTTASMSVFDTYVDDFLTYMWGIAPYSDPDIKARFRIIRVQVPSSVENIPAAYFQFDHLPSTSLPPYIAVGPTHPDYNQYTNTECVTEYYDRMDALKLLLPGYDEKSYILGVFNNNYYTGGGGKYCFTSLFNNSGLSRRVLLHEFGHTFGILGDEYSVSASTPYVKDQANNCALLLVGGNPVVYNPTLFPLFDDRNVTPYAHTTDASLIPWKHYINGSNPGVGTYDGANYSSLTSPSNSTDPVTTHWFRPTSQSCLMGNLSNLPFCVVCHDLISERIHEHVCDTTATVTEDFVERHQYITHWRKASDLVTSSSTIGDEITVKFVSGNSIQLSDGFTAVAGSDFLANIGDCTGPELINEYKTAGGNSGTLCPALEKFPEQPITSIIRIIPNPSNSLITIATNNSPIKSVSIYSIDGKLMLQKEVKSQQQYVHDISDYSKGIYLVNVETDDTTIISEKLIKN